MKPADSEAFDLSQVRFYVDENLAGLGLTLRKVRPFRDLVVGSHPPVQHLVPKDDPDWIPDVAGRDWVVVTNDKHIRTRPFEADRALEVGLRCVHLDPPGAKNPRVWDFLRLLLRHWDDVEALCGRTGPVWLQLDGRAHPWERDYQPGKPPRLLSDPRAERTRVTRAMGTPPAPPPPPGRQEPLF